MQPQHVKVECRGDAVELSGGSNAVGAAQRTPRNSLHSQTTESKIKKTGNNISSARQSVIHPFGWDAFGLPAERAALLHNTPASQWTSSNIASMKEQVHKMGLRLDWDREIATNDPKYYKWTQWIFLRMHASGLVEYKESAVLWDPVDQTVLANEQVVNGRAERSGALVVHKKLKQYFLKITRYAERLDKDLSGLDWPSSVISQQRNWIGKRKGVSISGNVDTARLNVFAIYGSADGGNCIDKASKVVENSQAAYVAIGPTHPLLDTLNKNTKTGRDVQVFINALLHGRNNSFDRYGGINTGLFWSPNSNSEESQTSANDSNDVLPIWIRNSMVHLPPESAILGQTTDVFSVKNGISPSSTRSIPNSTNRTLNWTRLVSAGSPATTYNLRDWLVSRQRAWGTPIPMVHCKSATCASVLVFNKGARTDTRNDAPCLH